MGEKGAYGTMKFIELSQEQQRIVFTQASTQTGINVNLAEKDWWICLVLLVNTTTSNPRKETLLLGESSLKPSNEDLTQQMISNEKRLPTIYWKRYLGVA